ncbi:MAG TPA: phage portal protein [Acidimicrobiales bacterium]|nr:phage portal protein [Acidimicrobiales bacterium]
MASLLRRLRGSTRSAPWPTIGGIDALASLVNQFSFNGSTYPLVNQTWGRTATTEMAGGLEGHVAALMQSPPAFAAQWTRSLVLSQARFSWRNPPHHQTAPRKLFGTQALAILERPWPNGTTGELITSMEWHAGLAGNAYVLNRGGRLRVLRPDWVTIVYGSMSDPDADRFALDAELLGYVYHPGGFRSNAKPETLLVSEVAHWAPIPDPLGAGVGMSWLTPVLREIQGDIAATTHKLKFFENGATPNLVVKGLPADDPQKFKALVALLEEQHSGLSNAYKTLYLSAGGDATVVGANLKDLDLKGVQGSHETRIAQASKVPATVLNISEGLAGSSLNAGNFGQARRNFADTWLYPSLRDLCGALSTIVPPPRDVELWFDTSDMPFVREDGKDAAEIEKVKAETIRSLVDGGFEPDSVVAAVQAQDMSLLSHSGKLSVQLQDPNATVTTDDEAAPEAPAEPKVDTSPRALAEMIQKIYLGVGKVVSAEEARLILNRAGAELPPGFEAETPPAPPPAPDDDDDEESDDEAA